ncbi:MAG: cytochrome C oxidase subunit IV family protein [Candidatus Omnitrophica bacterium]|nr:hypothetical protein [bacterium]NUN94774.1 cytochrome C oxidase subunit IV family protein [Candidatus Omnitrophota bacterium]
MSSAHGSHSGHGEQVGHIVGWPILVATWAALMVFTYITVAATYIDLGSLNLWLAMVIATIKAALVVMYFMHLRYDRPINALVFVISLSALALFLVLAMLDTAHYQQVLIPGYAPGMTPR